MQIKSYDLSQIKNEKIQIIIRLIIILSIYTLLWGINSSHLYTPILSTFTMSKLLLFMFIWNLTYYFIIKVSPYILQQQRIYFIGILDVLFTVFLMSHGGALSTYFTGLLLWYTVGYGMRYGSNVGYSVYFATLFGWIYCISTVPYWMENRGVAIGWLITYMFIPLYYFKLVNKLKNTIKQLHRNVDASQHIALHDTLTSLPNRTYFDTKLEDFTKKYKKFALFFIDLDGFKHVNDTLGHEAGDVVLTQAASRIQSGNHFCARLGGDEFVVIMHYNNHQELVDTAQYLVDVLSQPYSQNAEVSASIGIARYPEDAEDLHHLKKSADKAMYQSKKEGKNRFTFFEDI